MLAVITEVKHKLVYKAIDKYNLLDGHMRADTDGAPDGPAAPAKDPNFIKEYPECPMAFDQVIISIAQYFDLIHLTSYKLEDLWLNLMEIMCLERPNKYSVFRAVHHQGYRNIVLKDPLIQQIIRKVDQYKDSGLAHMNPKKYLEQIYDIRRNCHTVEETYADLEDQGFFSESLRQLVEYLHDDIASEEVIERPPAALLNHSHDFKLMHKELFGEEAAAPLSLNYMWDSR